MPAFTVRRAQITAIITGVLGVLLALATPLMPVKQTVAEISWPQSGTVESVSSPLFSYAPIDLEIDIPCRAVDDLPQGKTVLLSTTSPSAPKASDRGLFARVTNSSAPTVEVVTRNIPILSAPSPKSGRPTARRSRSGPRPTPSPQSSSVSPIPRATRARPGPARTTFPAGINGLRSRGCSPSSADRRRRCPASEPT